MTPQPIRSLPTVARMVFGSAAAADTELRAADEQLRAALPLSRRVGVVGLRGGSGTTSVAATLGSQLARRRRGRVLGVDAAGGRTGLHAQTVGVDRGEPVDPETTERRRLARTAAEARAGLHVTGSGLHLLDVTGGSPEHPRSGAATVPEWATEIAPIARFFDLVVTDWGVRPAAADLGDVAGASHVLLVVARADRYAAGEAAAAVTAVRESGGTPPVTLLTLADVGRTADRVLPPLRRRLGPDVWLLPADPARSEQALPTTRTLSSRSRAAHRRLGVAVMAAVVATAGPRPRPPEVL